MTIELTRNFLLWCAGHQLRSIAGAVPRCHCQKRIQVSVSLYEVLHILNLTMFE